MPEEWFDLNYRLQEEAIDTNINKPFLDLWIIRLRAMIPSDSKCFGLFMARINELALYCAARYADCCELKAAGELLFGDCDFFSKDMGSSSQIYGESCRKCHSPFLGSPVSSENHIYFLQDLIPISEEPRPLIPFLSGLLEDLGYLSEEYIMSVHRRMEKIKEVMEMFADQGMFNCEEFSRRLSSMDYDKKRQLQSIGCSFNMIIFNDLGRELHFFMGNGDMKSTYLKERYNTLSISYLLQIKHN